MLSNRWCGHVYAGKGVWWNVTSRHCARRVTHKHVGHRRWAISPFTETSSSSSLGACVLNLSDRLGAQEIGHRHLWGAGQLGGLVEIMGHVSGPPKIRMFKPVCMKDFISESACVCIVHSGSNTNKYPLKMPGPKSARVFMGKLHEWYIKARTPTVTNGPHDIGTLVGTLTAMLLRLCIPRRKIMCGCYTKIV